MRPAATSRRQHPEPPPTVLADSPLSAEAFRPSVPKLLQEPAQRQSPGRDLQPSVLQTTGHQVRCQSGPPRIVPQYAAAAYSVKDRHSRQTDVCRLSHATARHTDSHACLTHTHTHCESVGRLSGTHGSQLYTDIGWELFYSPAVLCN